MFTAKLARDGGVRRSSHDRPHYRGNEAGEDVLHRAQPGWYLVLRDGQRATRISEENNRHLRLGTGSLYVQHEERFLTSFGFSCY